MVTGCPNRGFFEQDRVCVDAQSQWAEAVYPPACGDAGHPPWRTHRRLQVAQCRFPCREWACQAWHRWWHHYRGRLPVGLGHGMHNRWSFSLVHALLIECIGYEYQDFRDEWVLDGHDANEGNSQVHGSVGDHVLGSISMCTVIGSIIASLMGKAYCHYSL